MLVPDIFRVFCLLVMGFFVNLRTERCVAVICYPEYNNKKIIVNIT